MKAESPPLSFCRCGRGQRTSLARTTDSRHGDIKGQPNNEIGPVSDGAPFGDWAGTFDPLSDEGGETTWDGGIVALDSIDDDSAVVEDLIVSEEEATAREDRGVSPFTGTAWQDEDQ